MKKAIVILGLVFSAAVQVHAQAGDLYGGLQGGYATYYKAPLYGLNLSYNISDPLQISLTGLMNPNIIKAVDYNHTLKENLQLYSTNLDIRLFLINMEMWATGPTLGGQYLYINKKDNLLGPDNLFGFNIGWHLQINMTDNLRINGGWRYSSIKDSDSYNLFYIGIGYAFNLF
ncbi:MAG: porin family protein [Dysgonamonadaceae bacterium]|nr:porin family protein [Dysgonamonadaceae bacterium]